MVLKSIKIGLKKIIHINKHVIAKNRKHGTNEPPITCKSYNANLRCHELEILDADGNVVATIKHSPHKPLKCGARVWIETTCEVRAKS